MALAFSNVPRSLDIKHMTTIRALVPTEFVDLFMPVSPNLTFGLTRYLSEVVVPFRREMGWVNNGFDVNLPVDIHNLRQLLEAKV